MKCLFLLKWFMKLNGFHAQADDMTTIFGSKQELIILHRKQR